MEKKEGTSRQIETPRIFQIWYWRVYLLLLQPSVRHAIASWRCRFKLLFRARQDFTCAQEFWVYYVPCSLQGAGTTASNKTLDLFLICLWEKIDNNGLLKSDGDNELWEKEGTARGGDLSERQTNWHHLRGELKELREGSRCMIIIRKMFLKKWSRG